MIPFMKRPSSFKFHIDRIGAEGIEGWAYHRRHRNPVRVEIMTTNRVALAKGMTDILRNDLGGRTCGFRFPVNPRELLALTPSRFLLFVDGVKVANSYFFVPVEQGLLERELVERHEMLDGLQASRLERENQVLLRRIAELENEAVKQHQGPCL